MTNGEKIKEIFPSTDSRLDEKTGIMLVKWVDGATKCFKADWWNAEYKEPTTKIDLAQERYQDLIEYFGDEKVAKTILESRKEFKAWLERLKWNVKRADELARELEQIKSTTKNDLGVDKMALLEKTYADFYSCEGGEGWLKIDGKEYSTDVGYALEGIDIFMEVFKRRLAESEPQER